LAPSRLLALALELRQGIYECFIDRKHGKPCQYLRKVQTGTTKSAISRQGVFSEIFLINQQIYREALPIVYGKIQLHVDVDTKAHDQHSTLNDLCHLNSLVGFQYIRHVSINVNIRMCLPLEAAFDHDTPYIMSGSNGRMIAKIETWTHIANTLKHAPALRSIGITWNDELYCKFE